MVDSWHDEPGTTPNTPSASRLAPAPTSVPPLDVDPYVALGQVMAAVTRLERKVDALALLPREMNQLRRDVEQDRGELVTGASSQAARHSSNRMAVLVSALFVLYEQAAPVLRAIWKGLHS